MSTLPKTDSSQAMQNLVSAYVDDDTELDESGKVETTFSDENERSDHSGTSAKLKSFEKRSKKNPSEPSNDEKSKSTEPAAKKAKLERKTTRLVSYGADDQDGEGEDEEDVAQHTSEDYMFSRFMSSTGVVTYNGTPMTPEELNDSLTKSLRHSLSEDDVQIPPEPSGNCSMRLQARIKKLHENVQHTGKDMNANIERRKEFRNPSIYDKLIEYCNIDEKGTNYPPELFNPTIWGEDSTYEVLAQVQRAEMDKREKERREKKDKALTVERLQGTKKIFAQTSSAMSPSGEQKRRTKWDSADSTTLTAATNSKTKSFP